MKKIILVLFMGLMIYTGWNLAGRVPAEKKEKLKTALSQAEDYEAKGFYKDANLEYEKALQIEESKDVRRKIVMNLYRMEDFKSFKKEAESYLKKNPDEEIYTYLIADYLDSSDRSTASKYLDKAEMEFPNSESLAELRSNLNGQFTLSYTDYSEVGEYVGGYIVARMPALDDTNGSGAATESDAVEKECGEEVLLKKNGKMAVMNTFEKICDVRNENESAEKEIIVSGVISGESGVSSLDDEGARRAVESEGLTYLGVEHDGWILEEKDSKWGFIPVNETDEKGNKKSATGFIFEDATAYDNGVAAVKQNSKWALVGEDGNKITDYIYDDVYMDELKNASRGGALFVKKAGETDYSLIDVKGKELSGEKYTDVKGFLGDKGVAAVEKNGKWGAVDNKGKEILACTYDEVGSSETNYIPYRKGDVWGYISPSGKELIEPQFEDMRAVSPDGYGFVKDRGTWEIITVYSIRGEESLFD